MLYLEKSADRLVELLNQIRRPNATDEWSKHLELKLPAAQERRKRPNRPHFRKLDCMNSNDSFEREDLLDRQVWKQTAPSIHEVTTENDRKYPFPTDSQYIVPQQYIATQKTSAEELIFIKIQENLRQRDLKFKIERHVAESVQQHLKTKPIVLREPKRLNELRDLSIERRTEKVELDQLHEVDLTKTSVTIFKNWVHRIQSVANLTSQAEITKASNSVDSISSQCVNLKAVKSQIDIFETEDSFSSRKLDIPSVPREDLLDSSKSFSPSCTRSDACSAILTLHETENLSLTGHRECISTCQEKRNSTQVQTSQVMRLSAYIQTGSEKINTLTKSEKSFNISSSTKDSSNISVTSSILINTYNDLLSDLKNKIRCCITRGKNQSSEKLSTTTNSRLEYEWLGRFMKSHEEDIPHLKKKAKLKPDQLARMRSHITNLILFHIESLETSKSPLKDHAIQIETKVVEDFTLSDRKEAMPHEVHNTTIATLMMGHGRERRRSSNASEIVVANKTEEHEIRNIELNDLAEYVDDDVIDEETEQVVIDASEESDAEQLAESESGEKIKPAEAVDVFLQSLMFGNYFFFKLFKITSDLR